MIQDSASPVFQGCTSDLIHIMADVIPRSAARGLRLNVPLISLMTLWSLLRWEVKIAQMALQLMGINMIQLQQDLDSLIHYTSTKVTMSDSVPEDLVTSELASIVDNARKQAISLQHSWIGTEHLLLALLTQPETGAAAFLASYGITYESVESSIAKILCE